MQANTCNIETVHPSIVDWAIFKVAANRYTWKPTYTVAWVRKTDNPEKPFTCFSYDTTRQHIIKDILANPDAHSKKEIDDYSRRQSASIDLAWAAMSYMILWECCGLHWSLKSGEPWTPEMWIAHCERADALWFEEAEKAGEETFVKQMERPECYPIAIPVEEVKTSLKEFEARKAA